MSFHQLDQSINKALVSCGYKIATPIQEKAIPIILEGKDLVASSQTGSGKTAAFVLPALHLLNLQPPSKKPLTRILILTPTRELAAQITKAAQDFGKFCRVNIISLVGGFPYPPQIKALARGAEIIVATPGRLMDHLENRRVDLSNVEMLVLDEADRMLDMGFIDDVEHIAKLTPPERQTLLFSATVDKKLTTVIRHLLKNPVRIDLSPDKMTPTQIKQELYKVSSPQHKLRLLRHFLNDSNIYKAIIFSATKINADKLANQLCDEGFSAAALHGDLRQNVRTRTIEQMRRGKIQFLVATDVAARGIDIEDLSLVINFDVPRFCEDYVHRIGRTGRAGKNGIAISFVLPTDARHLKSIERYLGQKLQVMPNIDLGGPAAPREIEPFDERPNRHHAQDRPTVSYRQRKPEQGRPFSRDNKENSRGRENSRDRDSYRSRPAKEHTSSYARPDKSKSSWKKGPNASKEKWGRDDRYAGRDDRSAARDDRYAGRDTKNDSGSKKYAPFSKEFSSNSERPAKRPFKKAPWQNSDRAASFIREETSFVREDNRPKKSYANKGRGPSDGSPRPRNTAPANQVARKRNSPKRESWTSDARSNKKSIEQGYGPLKRSIVKKHRQSANDESAKDSV